MNIEEAIILLHSHNVPDHIIEHSYKVAKVAAIIAEELLLIGFDIDKDLVLSSALLHDITKYDSIINRGEDHAVSGGVFLRERGYPNVAEIVENHIMLLPDNGNLIMEKKIIFYSDKRVKHTKVVSLDDRYYDLLERYGKSETSVRWIKDGFVIAKGIESELFSNINIPPLYLNIL